MNVGVLIILRHKFMIDHYKLITVNHKVLNTEDLQHFIVRHNDDKELIDKLN
mgnify:CR=1 FL=1